MNPRLPTNPKRLRRAKLMVCACAAGLAWGACAEVTIPPTATTTPPTGTPAAALPAAPAKPPTTTIARPVAISSGIRTATALTPPMVTAINAYVTTSFTRMLSDDPTAIEQARADLISGVASPGGTPCSAPYLTQYVSIFLPQMQAVVGKASLPKRLNAAIVLARVFENINSANGGAAVPLTSLHPLILTELTDKSDAVALWGMKAASQAIAASPAAPPDAIVKAIVPSVKAHNYNGAVTEEAYFALNRPTPMTIQNTIDLYKARIAGYANGAVPPDPAVDRRAASHLTNRAMWATLTPAQQTQVLGGMIRDNLVGASTAVVAPGIDAEAVASLRALLTGDGAAVFVAASGNPALGDLYIDADHLRGADSSPPPELAAKADRVIKDLATSFPTGNAAGGNTNAAVAK